MQWNDQGILLSSRKYGENSAIVTVFSAEHGVYAGMVRRAAGKGKGSIYQPGNKVVATWQARLHEHLGTFTCELFEAVGALIMCNPLRLAAVNALCALLYSILPEREPHAMLYAAVSRFLRKIREEKQEPKSWLLDYVLLEKELLQHLGFGLDLEECAATGVTADLVYISPKSARAVSRTAGEPYKDRLLPLLPLLRTEITAVSAVEPWSEWEVLEALKITGYFLEKFLPQATHRTLPPARKRLAEMLLISNLVT